MSRQEKIEAKHIKEIISKTDHAYKNLANEIGQSYTDEKENQLEKKY